MSEPRYRRHPDLRITALEGEGVVLHLRERRYFSVNATGLTILEAARESRTLEELIAAVMNEYEVSHPVAAATTRRFLEECLATAVLLEEQE